MLIHAYFCFLWDVLLTNDSSEQSNHADRDHKTGPAAPVVSGRDEGKQNLPEDGEKVHDVVETGRQFLLPALLIIVILTWKKKGVDGLVHFDTYKVPQ